MREREAQKEAASRKAQGSGGTGRGCRSQEPVGGQVKPKTSHGEVRGRGLRDERLLLGSSSPWATTRDSPWRKVHSSLPPHPRFLEAPPGLRAESTAECVARLDRRPPETEPTRDRAGAAQAEFPESGGRGPATPVGPEPAGV